MHPNLVNLVSISSQSKFDLFHLKVKRNVPDPPSLRPAYCSSPNCQFIAFGDKKSLFQPTCKQGFHPAIDVQERRVRPVCPGHTQSVPARWFELDVTAAPLRPRQPDHQVVTPPLQAQLGTLSARVTVHEGSPLAGRLVLKQVMHKTFQSSVSKPEV